MAEGGYESTNSRMAPLQSDRGARRKFSGALMGGGAMSLGLSSFKDLNNPNSTIESMPAFQINTMKGIPEKATIRTGNTSRNRMNSLMSVPLHK